MAKPLIYIVDDDPEQIKHLEINLEAFSDKFTIKVSDDPYHLLQKLHQNKDQEIALFLVDDDLKSMRGLDFIKKIEGEFPNAKKILLTRFKKNEETIHGFKDNYLDCYIIKPYTPVEEKLLPVIKDMLLQWEGLGYDTEEELTLVGPRWYPPLHQIMNFLSRNLYPYKFYDIEKNPYGWQLLKEHNVQTPHLALVIFPDGTQMINPEIKEIAQKVGLNIDPDARFYDLIIIGAGPAGLAASVYAASEGLSTLVIEKDAPGGQAGASAKIDNYLGFPGGISGEELSKRAIVQAEKFGVEILRASEANDIKFRKGYKTVVVNNELHISCYCIILCNGVSYRKLNAPGLDKLLGAGVYYGTVNIEAPLCNDEQVIIIGGGNSAGQAAMHLSHFASSVKILVMEESLKNTMSQYLVEQIEKTSNIEVMTNTIVEEVMGNRQLEKARVFDKSNNERKELACSALFIYIGAEPSTSWLPKEIFKDEQGFIITGMEIYENNKNISGRESTSFPKLLETNVPGIFAAGDVRKGSAKRVASAVGEGAMAVTFVHQYINQYK